MKKALLFSIVALAAILVACGNKYVGAYEKLVNETSAKLDSVTTIEQLDVVAASFATESQNLKAEYASETLSAEERSKVSADSSAIFAKFEELKVKLTPVVDTACCDSTAMVVEVK